MEVVLAVTIASQGASLLLEVLEKHASAAATSTRTTSRPTDSSSESASLPADANVSETNTGSTVSVSDTFASAGCGTARLGASTSPSGASGITGSDAADEEVDITPETIDSLARKVALLREKARLLNAPDTLVLWARATREADLLETRLDQMKASTPQDPYAALFSVLRQQSGSSRGFATSKRKYVTPNFIRMVMYVFLWVYFRWRGDRYVLRVDCASLRPLAWLLSRRVYDECPLVQNNALCQAGEKCAVSYYLFAILAGGVVQRLFTWLRRRG